MMGPNRRRSRSQEAEESLSGHNSRAKRQKAAPPEERELALELAIRQKSSNKRDHGKSKKQSRRSDSSKTSKEAKTIYEEVRQMEKEEGVPIIRDSIYPAPELNWDPEKSYVGLVEVMKNEVERPPRQPRWQAPAGKPIMSRNYIPKEWNWREWDRDLDRDDIDGQIERLRERIEDGILPYIFEDRLKEYEHRKEIRDATLAKFPGKSYEVAQRLEDLYFMKDSIASNDEYKQTSNIESLIKAYESGKLDWNDGLVTYWSKGKQLCQPRPLDWDEFDMVNTEHDGWESFWVEGLNPPGPAMQLVKSARFGGIGKVFGRLAEICLRIPGKVGGDIEYDFLDDTGASFTSIFSSNITSLETAANRAATAAGRSVTRLRRPPIAGTGRISEASGTLFTVNIVILEANMRDDNNVEMSPKWHRIQCIVDPDPPQEYP